MLLPWPVFAALFFVFRNTIEFRGVPFLWLHDISVRDPYFILPLLLAGSSFLVSWIGMRNMPPNPQTKMMTYTIPLFMTAFFWNIAAGLNLYYVVQNITSIPQQWYLSNERAKAPGQSASGTGGVSDPGGTGGTGGTGGGGGNAKPPRGRPSGGGASVAASTSGATPRVT